MSLTSAEKASPQIQALDDSFVVFYVVELLLRLGYYRKLFFLGKLHIVWWHWLDFFLVIDGIVFGVVSLEGCSARVAGSLQYLRILRYLRVIKLVHTVFEANLAWTESGLFQTFIMAIICLNAIVMGAEVQHPELKEIWRLMEHLFLLIFSFELAVRTRFVGCRPFLTKRGDRFFNVLDFTIVVGGIIDQWLLPLFLLLFAKDANSSSTRQMSSILRLVRVMRLLRILRLLRLIKNVPPLYTLIVGILKAMQGMSWVMLLTVTVLYIAALLGVKLVGPLGLLITPPDSHDDPATRALARLLKGHGGGHTSSEDLSGQSADMVQAQMVEVCFPNMFDAIFNMFKVMQMDLSPMEPLFEWAPSSRYIIMFYVVVTNWAIFSILTAVVSDEMAKVTGQVEEEQQVAQKSKRNEELVEKLFGQHTKITGLEFEILLLDPDKKHEFCSAAEIEEEDLKEFFAILCEGDDAEDKGGEQSITKEAFLNGLEKERDSVNQRAMMKLESRLDHVDKTIKRQIHELEDTIVNQLGMDVIKERSHSFGPHAMHQLRYMSNESFSPQSFGLPPAQTVRGLVLPRSRFGSVPTLASLSSAPSSKSLQ